MKRGVAILGLAVMALGLGYWVAGQRHADELTGVRGSDLSWLQIEFNLSDEQFAAVSAAHRDYATVCSRHCADILTAQRNLDTLRANGAGPNVVAGAEEELTRLENVCNNATLAHVRRVAGLMPPEAGSRFLTLVEPHLATQPHDGDRGLDR